MNISPKVLFCCILFVALSLVPFAFILNQLTNRVDNSVLFTFLVIGISSGIQLGRSIYRHGFSLDTTHWVFIYFLLFLFPLVQYVLDSPPGQAKTSAWPTYLVPTNLALISWIIAYSIFYEVAATRRTFHQNSESGIGEVNLFAIILLNVICVAIVFVTLGFNAVFFRSAVYDKVDFGRPLLTSISVAGRALPVAALLLYLGLRRKRTPSENIGFVITILCAAIINSPTSIPRYWSGAIGIGLLAIFFLRRQRSSWILVWTFAIALIFTLPLLNAFRQTTSSLDQASFQANDIQSTVTAGDYDAYEMFVNVVGLVDGSGPSLGHGVSSSVLFFIPREFWSDKSQGTGMTVAQYYHMGFANLSAPLPAEGYLDFGIIGTLLFGGVFGASLGALDKRYWEKDGSKLGRASFWSATYPALLGLVFYMMRGSLIASFAYSSAYVGDMAIIFLLAVMLPRRLKRSVNTLAEALPVPSSATEL